MEDGGWNILKLLGRAEILGSLNHSVQHGTDTLPNSITLLMNIRSDVLASQRAIQPGLRLHRFAHGFVYLIGKTLPGNVFSPMPLPTWH